MTDGHRAPGTVSVCGPGEEKIKMSQKMQGKNISVGNNMRAKNSEYTCANSPPALSRRMNFKKLPRCLLLLLLFSYSGERQAADLEAVLADNDPITWHCPQSWPCCWPGGSWAVLPFAELPWEPA